MLKRISCILTSLALFLIIAFSPLCLSSNASRVEYIPPFSEVKFSVVNFPYGNYYYLLLSKSLNGSYAYELLYVDYDNKDVLKFYTDIFPTNTYFKGVIHRIGWTYPSDSQIVTFGSSRDTLDSFYSFAFDNYNTDSFPSSGCSYILASNVDIYDINGKLLQPGNYNSFLKFFNYGLEESRIKNYTSSQEPAVTTTTSATTPDSSGGDSGSSGDSETSRGILDTVKNMFSKLKEISDNFNNLPQKISEIIGNFNTNIVNSIKGFFQDAKDYLVYLFVPSDNSFERCKELIDDKFKFVHQALDYYKNFFNFALLDEPPDTYVTIYGETISFMNWDLYDKYKPMIDNIIVFCAWFFYIRRLVKRIPGIIGGFHT